LILIDKNTLPGRCRNGGLSTPVATVVTSERINGLYVRGFYGNGYGNGYGTLETRRVIL